MYDLNEICTAKGMHLAHFNIRSLVNKWDTFKIQCLSSNLHFIGLSETWLSDKLPNEIIELSNEYTLLRNDRKWCDEGFTEPKKGGGVAIYIKNNVNFSDTTYSHFNTSNINIESQWVLVTLPNSEPILVGNVYRPPQGSVDAFIQALDNIFNEIDATKFEIYIIGDINIDMSDKQNESQRKFVNFFKPLGLCQIIKSPTRFSTTKNSILDVCVTNSDFIKKSGVCDVNLSDHQMILITRKKTKFPKKKCTFTGRSYRKYNKNEFQNDIINADWTEYNNESTVEGKWNQFIQIIRNKIDSTCPVKEFKIKQQKEPWITGPLIELIKDKDYALKMAKKHNDPQLWIKAKRLRNSCTNRLRKARADFIKENLENNVGNSKKFWKNIQDVLPSKKGKSPGNFDLFDSNDKRDIPNEETANYINDYFVQIGPKLAQQYDLEWNFNGERADIVLDDIETNLEEIIKLCREININKSSCIEHLCSEILRDAFLAVPEILMEIFNLSFELSDIPNAWKIAKVTPLQKSGGSKEVSNLRPISLLPLPSKLIEKIVHNRIYTHCNNYNLLDPKQGGFRPGHSTISTTAFYINDIYEAMNNNETTISIYIDAMKAFDTVNHEILLKKIKYFGITGKNAKWLQNYLSNRKQCTYANDILSQEALITCGVPQGSVCGPLLFLLYINDISKVLTNCKVSLYADDTVLYYSGKNLDDVVTTIQSDLNLLSNWCSKNRLTINCKKTKYCVYGMRSIVKKSKSQDMMLSLNNTVLEKVCSYKYLGFILDDQLNFNKHVKSMTNLITHKLYLLSRIRKYLTKVACISIFKTMILSLIEYGDIIYAGTSQNNITTITNLFYRGLRICDSSNTKITRDQLCHDCHIAPLDVRRDIHLLLFMCKQRCNEQLLKRTRKRTRLHQAPVFKLCKPNNEKVKQNVLYRGAILWNGLPAHDRNMTFNDFKTNLKRSQFA